MTDPTYSSPDELNSAMLDRIAALLSGVEWEVSYLDDIAELVRFTGREILDSGEPVNDLHVRFTDAEWRALTTEERIAAINDAGPPPTSD